MAGKRQPGLQHNSNALSQAESRTEMCFLSFFLILKSSLGHTSLCMHETIQNRRGLEKHES